MTQSKNSSRQKNQPEKPDSIMSLLRSCIDDQISPAMPCEPVWKTQKTKSGRTEYQLLNLGRSAAETSDELWPTPRANKPEGYSSNGYRPTLAQRVTGEVRPAHGMLSPDWVECLMNYPLGWTDLDCGEPEPWPGWPAIMGKELWPTHTAGNHYRQGQPAPSEGNGHGKTLGGQCHEILDQYPWEPPRTTAECKNRAKRLKALGNSVVPRQSLGIFLFIRTIFDVLDSNGQNDQIKTPREPGGMSYDVSENAAETKKTA